MNRHMFGVLIVCTFSLAVCSSAGALELLLNPSLDLTTPHSPNPMDHTILVPQPADWTVVGTKTNSGAFTNVLTSEPWAGREPTPLTNNGTGAPFDTGTGCGGLDCAGYFKPFTGDLVGGDLVTGHLQQTVLATPGATYQLTVWAGADQNYSGLIPDTQTETVLAIEFLDDGFLLLGSVELDLQASGLGVPNDEDFAYRQFSLSGVAPAGSHYAQVRFSMIDAYAHPAGGGQALVVDDFSLRLTSAVPEPSTTITLGLLLLGMLGIRRRMGS